VSEYYQDKIDRLERERDALRAEVKLLIRDKDVQEEMIADLQKSLHDSQGIMVDRWRTLAEGLAKVLRLTQRDGIHAYTDRGDNHPDCAICKLDKPLSDFDAGKGEQRG
jgi:hypothetical protein